MIAPDALSTVQFEVTKRMRYILVHWMIRVADENWLSSSTVYLAILLLDKCLDAMVVARVDFQLLGCVCLVIAAKFLETSTTLTYGHISDCDSDEGTVCYRVIYLICILMY